MSESPRMTQSGRLSGGRSFELETVHDFTGPRFVDSLIQAHQRFRAIAAERFRRTGRLDWSPITAYNDRGEQVERWVPGWLTIDTKTPGVLVDREPGGRLYHRIGGKPRTYETTNCVALCATCGWERWSPNMTTLRREAKEHVCPEVPE